MTKKSFVYILSIVLAFTIGVSLMYGEEILIFHDRQTVYVLSTSPDGGSIKKELINNAYAVKMTLIRYDYECTDN